jgi:hypothetical protein
MIHLHDYAERLRTQDEREPTGWQDFRPQMVITLNMAAVWGALAVFGWLLVIGIVMLALMAVGAK